jgi:hypothetical protein
LRVERAELPPPHLGRAAAIEHLEQKPLGAVSITLWPLSERSFPSAASTE